MIEKILKESGFSEKEVSVYLALFALGSAVVSGIAKRAAINRSTAYVILDLLAKRGLVSFAERRGVRLYNAASPEHLVQYLEKSAKKYANLAGVVKKAMPELKSLQKAGQAIQSRPKVQLFEGQEGIKTVYEETLASLEGIRSQTFKKKEFKASPVAGGEFSDLPQIVVHGQKIILISPEEKFAAVVESPELANKLKKILDSARQETKGQPILKPAVGSKGI